MAFDDKTRNRLNSFVSQARELLTKEFTQQCQVEFGLNPKTGEIKDLTSLRFDDEKRQTAIILRETIAHYSANLPSKSKKAETDNRVLIERVIREQAFTILNRLCALRMAEARDLIIQSVAKGAQSKGFQLYQHVVGPSLGSTGAAYEQYLFSLFDEFAIDLAVLFDRFSPQGRLFPRDTVLTELLGLINDPEINHLWAEDETIGWIYQYFNSKEERKAMRDASQAPRNSRELAVRNQFFTPRYVVEFLTDNTLGRIWYEMRQGNMPWVDDCRYLVRRPDEVFLSHMTGRDKEHRSESTIAMVELLLSGTKETFPEFHARDPQPMIELAHCVGAYTTLGERVNEMPVSHVVRDEDFDIGIGPYPSSVEAARSVYSGQCDGIKTQHILEVLFCTCRADRHGGDGSVYSEAWFASACNEVRRRILHSREGDLSQEEMLRAPVVIPYRPLKDPRDIRMLDPACGSMHFGLYAFDLYLKIYDEYWDLCHDSSFCAPVTEHRLPTEEYADKAAWMKAAPKLIIEHNIHGIDIDPRAVQIAGLSLWLRAQRAWRSQGLAAGDRPQVTRSNVVCAEPMPGDQQQLVAFCKTLHPAIAQMVAAIFDEMKLAGEAGSLLKIEQEITGLVAAAKKQWEKEPKAKQLELFDADVVKERQLEFDLSGITDQQFFLQAEETIYEALLKFASETSEGGFRRKLFTGDAEKGFALIALCNVKHDVILMNPPFGEPVDSSQQYLRREYDKDRNDIMACFLTRTAELLQIGGRLGVISSRTVFFNTFCGDARKRCMLGSCQVTELVDLGWRVLDGAAVEAAGYCIQAHNATGQAVAIRALRDIDKEPVILKRINLLRSGAGNISETFLVEINLLSRLPHQPFAYWMSRSFLRTCTTAATFKDAGIEALVVLSSADNFRYLRLHWEVPVEASTIVGPEAQWVPMVKGGEYNPLYDDVHLLLSWHKGGRELLQSTAATVRSARHYGRPGGTYPYRTGSGFCVRTLPAGCAFSDGGHGLLKDGEQDKASLLQLIAYCHTRVARATLEIFLGEGGSTSAEGAARNYVPRAIEQLPSPPFGQEFDLGVANRWLEFMRSPYLRDETSREFYGVPDLLKTQSINEVAAAISRFEDIESAEILNAVELEDKRISKAFGLSVQDLAFLDHEFGPHVTTSKSSNPNLEEAAQLYCLGKDELTRAAMEAVGATRYTAKKTYLVSRRIELISRTLNATPNQVVGQLRMENPVNVADLTSLAFQVISFAVGLAFGRWSVAYTPNSLVRFSPEDAFSPLPILQPAANENGSSYPAILVDDLAHEFDVVRQVSNAVTAIAPERSEMLLPEALAALGTQESELRAWLHRKYFELHLTQYSKSRRYAPIYWPISTESGRYTIWLYYHRLTDQSLYKVVNDFIEPKLKDGKMQLSKLRSLSIRSSSQENELAMLTELESELEQFKVDLLEIAAFWKPNLNDGVQITAAPLWKFLRHTSWRNKLKETWEELKAGDYDWAHLALSIWPERVVKEKCITDRSIAIAHDLEEKLWHEVKVKKTSPSGKDTTKTEWQPRKLSDAELNAIVAEVKRR
jgi:hypothetical protein